MGNSFVEAEYKDPGYMEAKKRSQDLTTGIFDATIADSANKAAQSGSVQGVANTGRLSADTYARVSAEKARRLSAIEDQYNNYELQHKAAFNNQQALARQQWAMEKPNFLNWLGFGVNTLGSIASIPVGGAGGSVLGSILGVGKNPSKPPTPTNYGQLQSTFFGTPAASSDISQNPNANFVEVPPLKLDNNSQPFGSQWGQNNFGLNDGFNIKIPKFPTLPLWKK